MPVKLLCLKLSCQIFKNYFSVYLLVISGLVLVGFMFLVIFTFPPFLSQDFLQFFLLLSEKAMAPHSSSPAWKTPWTEEPGGLQSMGSLRVGHDWATSLSIFTFMHCRSKWQPTPVFLPGESQGQGSLVGCCLWGH